MTPTTQILREVARATADAPRYDKSARRRLTEEFEARFGYGPTLAAREALWAFYDWRNGENCARHRNLWVLAVLFAACAIESEQSQQDCGRQK